MLIYLKFLELYSVSTLSESKNIEIPLETDIIFKELSAVKALPLQPLKHKV